MFEDTPLESRVTTRLRACYHRGDRVRANHRESRPDRRRDLHPGGRDVTVSAVVGQLATGCRSMRCSADYPYLERVDIRAALAYAAAVSERELPPPTPA